MRVIFQDILCHCYAIGYTLISGICSPWRWPALEPHGIKAIYNAEAFQKHMKEFGITHYGLAPDEVWTAYKPIEFVMNVQSDLVKVVVMGEYVLSDDGD